MDVLIGWPGGDWQATAQLAATLVGGYLFILWATSVLWVYRDIQQRTRDPVSQLTAVAISIVFPLVSLPIYAALRPSETLQDAYLRLLEREVLLSELGTLQGGSEPRRTASRASSTAGAAAVAEVVADAPPAAPATPATPATPAARPAAAAPLIARPVRTSAERPRSAPAARETPRTPAPREAPARESQPSRESPEANESQQPNDSKRAKKAKPSNESRSESDGSDSEPGEQLDEAVRRQV
ncbi:MAG: hypothetical protein HOH95_10650 [Dehalococcoidia bacterium]|nr:hypothetical protein [Dehalococcoidia bacterium]